MSETVLICPSCAGTKIAKLTGLPCSWCGGAKHVNAETALRYAKNLKRTAIDWRLSGHHGASEEAAMAEEASRIETTLGSKRS